MFRFKEDTAPPITYRDPVADANGDRPTTHHYCPYPNHQLTLRLHPVFAIVDLYIKWVKHNDQESWTPEEQSRQENHVVLAEKFPIGGLPQLEAYWCGCYPRPAVWRNEQQQRE